VGAISATTSINRTSATGEVNSLVVDYRVGTQNQDAMPGFDDVKVEQGVGIKVARVTGSLSRTTTSALFSRLRVRIGIGALFFIDENNADVKGTSVPMVVRYLSMKTKLFQVNLEGLLILNMNIKCKARDRGWSP
jgi:predicted phage tail protein